MLHSQKVTTNPWHGIWLLVTHGCQFKCLGCHVPSDHPPQRAGQKWMKGFTCWQPNWGLEVLSLPLTVLECEWDAARGKGERSCGSDCDTKHFSFFHLFIYFFKGWLTDGLVIIKTKLNAKKFVYGSLSSPRWGVARFHKLVYMLIACMHWGLCPAGLKYAPSGCRECVGICVKCVLGFKTMFPVFTVIAYVVLECSVLPNTSCVSHKSASCAKTMHPLRELNGCIEFICIHFMGWSVSVNDGHFALDYRRKYLTVGGMTAWLHSLQHLTSCPNSTQIEELNVWSVSNDNFWLLGATVEVIPNISKEMKISSILQLIFWKSVCRGKREVKESVLTRRRRQHVHPQMKA